MEGVFTLGRPNFTFASVAKSMGAPFPVPRRAVQRHQSALQSIPPKVSRSTVTSL